MQQRKYQSMPMSLANKLWKKKKTQLSEFHIYPDAKKEAKIRADMKALEKHMGWTQEYVKCITGGGY